MPSRHRMTRIVVGCGILLAVVGVLGIALSARFAWQRLHPREADVYGVYVAKYRDAKETVTLNTDHTYTQDVESALLDQPVHNSGVWAWSNDDWGRIDMRDCVVVADFDGYLREDFSSHHQLCRYSMEREVAFIFGPLILGSSESYPRRKVK
jgi:hypothetical protein